MRYISVRKALRMEGKTDTVKGYFSKKVELGKAVLHGKCLRSCNGTGGAGWDRRKEWHRLCHVGKLQQRVLSLLPVLSLSC